MKRIFSIIFALYLIVALSLSVSAESTNKLTYAVGASAPTASANAEITVFVKVTENSGICWAKAVVSYDSSVLTYMDASTDSSAFNAPIAANNPYPGEVVVTLGNISVLFASNPDVYKNTGDFIALKFKVNENAKLGDTLISVNTAIYDAVKIVNSAPDYNYNVKNASMTIRVNSDNHKCVPAAAVKENEIPATCQTDGKYDLVVYCTSCGGVISRETKTVAKGEHTAGTPVRENIKEANCQAAGSYDEVTKCIHCRTEISRKKIELPKTDHTPGEAQMENLRDSTCTQKGSYDLTTYCLLCKTIISKTSESLDYGSHVPGVIKEENHVAATCNKPGSYEEVTYCTICNKEAGRVKKEIPVEKHVNNGSVKENQKVATCTQEGSYDEVVYCAVCEAEIARVTIKIDKVAHTPSKAKEENKKTPTSCAADGTYDSVVYCTVCDIELSRVVQNIPASKHTPGPVATETAPQTCKVCNKVLAPKLTHVHNWSVSWVKDAVGHWYSCSGCDDKNNYEEHRYTNGCDVDCNICGADRGVDGHQYTNDCDDVCNKCSEKRSIAGHVYDNNCDGTCNVCDIQRPVTHIYDNNCDTTCNICNAPRIAADHAYGAWTTIKDATTTEKGVRERECLICGYKDSEEIPAIQSSETTAIPYEPPVEDTSKETGEASESETSAPEDVTTPETVLDTTPITSDTGDEGKGCGSMVSSGIFFILIFGFCLFKKKD